MTDLVDPTEIEAIVGARRHLFRHLGRAVSAEQTVYILHSEVCLDTFKDLRKCPFSEALDRGVDEATWRDYQDATISLGLVVPPGDLFFKQAKILFPVTNFNRYPGVAPQFRVDLVPSSKEPGTTRTPQESS